MELKPRYKETEVGVIPEDWEVQKLGSIATFLDGMRRPVKSSDRARMKGSIPYYGASGVVDYVDDYIFDEELVLLGEDGENILSRNLPLAFRISGKTWVNNHAHVIRPNSGISIGFLTEYLDSLNYESLNSGTAQPKLNKQRCLQIPVALPSSSDEQHAIATALSDADALLDGLDRLIAKKRDLKKAVMQQLLTDKTRLPGFEGEWELKTLGEIATIKDGTHQTPKYVASGVPFYSVEHVTSGDFSNTKFISIEEHRFLSQSFKIEKSDILMTRIGSIGDCKLIDWDVEASFYVSLALLKIRSDASSAFIAHYSNSRAFKEEVKLHSLPSAVPKKINLGPISNVAIKIPPTLEEQVAIATVLTDMDADISAFEQRRNKTKDIKQAMMQELLTGKTRLVELGEPHA